MQKIGKIGNDYLRRQGPTLSCSTNDDDDDDQGVGDDDIII